MLFIMCVIVWLAVLGYISYLKSSNNFGHSATLNNKYKHLSEHKFEV